MAELFDFERLNDEDLGDEVRKALFGLLEVPGIDQDAVLKLSFGSFLQGWREAEYERARFS